MWTDRNAATMPGALDLQARMPTPARQCTNHPERAAFALCMSCRSSICQECATQWDGIWHCNRCLAVRRGATVERAGVGGWVSLIVAAAVLLILSIQVMVWSGVLIAGLF
jgi:hypothetical protein